ncbi:phage tail tape measure protein [Gammaproteobacteria bacterium AS21]
MNQSLSLDVILSTIDRASAPLRNIDRASSETARQFKETRDQLKQLQRQQKDIKSFRELQKANRQTRREFTLASAKAKELSDQLKQTAHPTREMIREFDRARTAVNQLGNRQAQQTQRMRDARNALRETGVRTNQLTETQRELTRSIERNNRALSAHQAQLNRTRQRQEALNRARRSYQNTRGMAGNMAGTGMSAIAGGTASMLAVAKTASVGMDFDAQMSKVQALTRLQKDDPELAAMRNQARNLGATTKFSAGEAAGGQSYLAMAGFSPDAITKAMPGMLSLAAAAGTELAETADVGSNILSGFKLKANDMGRVGDVLTATFTRSNTNLSMLGETMSYVAPVAAGLGSSLEEASAMAGKLGDIGIQASSAGTAMRSIYSRLAAPPKMAADAINQLNIKTKDSKGNLRPIATILKDIDKATKGMGNTARTEMLKAIAGANAYSALEGLAVSAGTGELQELIESLKQAKGEANQVAKVMSDNASGDLQELVSSIQDVAIEITSLNNDSLRDLIQNTTRITRGVGRWIKSNPELAASIAKVVTIGGALLLAFGAIALIISTLLMPFALLRFALARVGLTGGLFIGMAKKLGSGLMWLGRVALPFVGKALAILGRALLMNPIGLAVTGIATAAYLIYDNWAFVSGWVGDMWEKTKQHFFKFKDYVTTWWTSVGGTFEGALLNITGKLINWSPFGVLYAAISRALADLGIELPEKFTEFGGMLIDGLINGIKSKGAALKKSILGIGDDVSGWFKDKLDINSPSKVFRKHGNSVMYGLEKGLGDNQNTLKPMSKLTTRLKQAGAGLAVSASTLTAPQALAIDQRAPLNSANNGANQSTTVIEKIEIHAAPGMDEQALARFVALEIRKHEQQKQNNQRSQYSDYD